MADDSLNRMQYADCEPHCEVSGGELVSIFSGNPCNEDVYTSNKCHAFLGRAVAVVKTKQKGSLCVTVKSEGLESVSTKITAI